MEDKERKHYSEMTYRELDIDALIEHAESLGGELSEEAIEYIEELNERITPTTEMLEEERATLKAKTKIVNVKNTIIDETTGKEIEIKIPFDTKTPLYTDTQIEKRLKDKRKSTVQKYSTFTQKQMYCKKYWPDILPQRKQADKLTVTDKIAAAKARVKARNKKK